MGSHLDILKDVPQKYWRQKEWLGLPRDVRQPTYFHILGVDPEDDDEEAIKRKANDLYEKLSQKERDVKNLAAARIAGELKTAVSTARATLTDPSKRADYVAELQAEFSNKALELLKTWGATHRTLDPAHRTKLGAVGSGYSLTSAQIDAAIDQAVAALPEAAATLQDPAHPTYFELLELDEDSAGSDESAIEKSRDRIVAEIRSQAAKINDQRRKRKLLVHANEIEDAANVLLDDARRANYLQEIFDLRKSAFRAIVEDRVNPAEKRVPKPIYDHLLECAKQIHLSEDHARNVVHELGFATDDVAARAPGSLGTLPRVRLGAIAAGDSKSFRFELANTGDDPITVALRPDHPGIEGLPSRRTIVPHGREPFGGLLRTTGLSSGQHVCFVEVSGPPGAGQIAVEFHIPAEAPSLWPKVFWACGVLLCVGLVVGLPTLSWASGSAACVVGLVLWLRARRGPVYVLAGGAMLALCLFVPEGLLRTAVLPGGELPGVRLFSARMEPGGIALSWEGPARWEKAWQVRVVRSKGDDPPSDPKRGRPALCANKPSGECLDADSLEAGATYAYAIFVCTQAPSPRSSPGVIARVSYLPPVREFQASEGPNGAKLSWRAVPGARRVIVRRAKTQASGDWVEVYYGGGTSFEDKSFKGQTAAVYEARAYYGAAKSRDERRLSSPVQAILRVPPPVDVHGFAAQAQAKGIQLTWRLPSLWQKQWQIHIVRQAGRSPQGLRDGKVVFLGARAEALTDAQGLVNGVRYYYRAYACGLSGASSGVLADAVLLPDVSRLQSKPTRKGVELLWQLPAAAVAAAVVRHDGRAPTPEQPGVEVFHGAAGSFLDRNVKAGQLYHYQVWALYGSGGRSPGLRQSCRALAKMGDSAADKPPPPPLQRFAAHEAVQGVELTWRAPERGRHVVIRRAKTLAPQSPADWVEVYSGKGSAFLDTACQGQGVVIYEAQVHDGPPGQGLLDNARVSTPVRHILKAAPPPDVTGFAARAEVGGMRLSWHKPTEWQEHWRVQIVRKAQHPPQGPTDGQVVLSASESASFLDVQGIANGVRYYYRAYAKGLAGVSPGVLADGVLLPDVTQLQCVPQKTGIALTWECPAGAKGTVVMRWEGRRPSSGMAGREVFSGLATKFRDRRVVAGHSYSYRVHARYGGGLRAPGVQASCRAAATASVAEAGEPDNPLALAFFSATMAQDGIVLAWEGTPEWHRAWTVHVVRKEGDVPPKSPSDGLEVYSGRAQRGSARDTNSLEPGASYAYSIFVRGSDARGCSPAVSAHIAYLPKVTAFVAREGLDGVNLSWRLPTGTQGVVVRRARTATPRGAGDWVEVYAGTGSACVDSGVALAHTLVYEAQAQYGARGSTGKRLASEPVRTSFAPPPRPPDVQSFACLPRSEGIELTWQYPKGWKDCWRLRVVRNAGSAPQGPEDGKTVFAGSGPARFVDTEGLKSGVKYGYRAFSDGLAGASRGVAAEVVARLGVLSLVCAGKGDGIELSWDSPANASFVLVLRRKDRVPRAIEDGAVVFRGRQRTHVDRQVEPGQTYHYKLFVYYATGQHAAGPHASCTAPAAPPPVLQFQGAEAEQGAVRLSWRKPECPGLAGVRIVRGDTEPPDQATDGKVVYDGLGESVTDPGDGTGKDRHYSAFCYTENGHSEPRKVTVRRAGPQAHTVRDFRFDVQLSGIRLRWSLPAQAKIEQVRIVRSSKGFPASREAGVPVYEGQGNECTDKYFSPGRIYYYTAFARDASGWAASGARVRVHAVPMARIEAGTFLMGSEPQKEGDADEWRPDRREYVEAFAIDVFEVTNAAYERFVNETNRTPPAHWRGSACPLGKEGCPVVGVTWQDAKAFAEWTGKRLPTEAEWEKAARGADGRTYPWGNQRPDRDKANLGKRDTRDAHERPNGRSPHGCYDMAGNAWEWTASDYVPYPGAARSGPYPDGAKVIRGGGYLSPPRDARCANREFRVPSFAESPIIGFRCARDAE